MSQSVDTAFNINFCFTDKRSLLSIVKVFITMLIKQLKEIKLTIKIINSSDANSVVR